MYKAIIFRFMWIRQSSLASLFLCVNRLGRESNLSLSFNAEVKHESSCTSTSFPHDFIACTGKNLPFL